MSWYSKQKYCKIYLFIILLIKYQQIVFYRKKNKKIQILKLKEIHLIKILKIIKIIID